MKRAASFLYQYPFLLFLLFLFMAYLPVFLPFFHLKNDLITQNLPTRFVISESLYSGYFPWWNPYIHYGIPQYGDMNNGFWNPVLWVIAKTSGYNIYSITLEEMFYLLIGGWGFYKVVKELFSKETALLTGLAYICCGYAAGHLQHFIWITGIAFFPYVLLYFIRVNKNPLIKNFIAGGLAVFFFVSSTHPGLIIGAAYFFLFALIFIFLLRKSLTKEFYSKKFWMVNLCFLLTGCLMSIVVIVSNWEVLQHISRGNKVSIEESLLAPTSLQSYISLLFPLPVHKSSFFNTDISMRNMYGGIAMITGLFFFFSKTKIRIILYSLIPLLFFILLAAGGWFKAITWHAFPLIGFVRLNGEFAYFVLLIFLLLAAAGLNSVLKQMDYKILLSKFFRIVLGLVLGAGLISLLYGIISKSSILFTENKSSGREFLRSFFENLSFADLFFIQALLLLITIGLLKKYKFNFPSSVFITCLNLVITTWLTLPYTGLGMKSKKEMQAVINTFPKGINKQELVPVGQTQLIPTANRNEFIMLSSYSKKIGHPETESYPVQLNSNINYFSDFSLTRFINRQAWLFLSSDTTIAAQTNFDSASILISENGPGKIKCTVQNSGYKYLVLLQNNYPHWKMKIDDKPVQHFTAFKTFIALPVNDGSHTIEFCFNPKPVRKALWINGALVLAALLLSVSKKIREKKM